MLQIYPPLNKGKEEQVYNIKYTLHKNEYQPNYYI
jgi:hypothetical protein